MKIANVLTLGVLGLLQAASAWADQGDFLYARSPVVPKASNPHREFPTAGHQWVAELEKAGIFNRSQSGPYRIALPLASFGNSGATLKFTYARSLPGSAGSSGPLLFVNIPLD